MAEQYGSGVKFESKAAEASIERFANKVGKLTAAAKNAKTEAAAMASNWARANSSMAATAVNAGKAATGTLSFAKNADQAARAARGLLSELQPTRIGAASRALGALSERAAGAAISLRQTGSAAGSLATQMGRAASSGGKLISELRGVGSAATSAAKSAAKLMAEFSGNKLSGATRSFGSLVGSFRATQSRMASFRSDTSQVVTQINRIGTAGTTGAKGIDRISSALGTVIPKMQEAIGKAVALGAALNNLGGAHRVSFSATGGGSTPKLPSAPSAAGFDSYANGVKKARKELQGMGEQLISLRNLARYYIAGLGISKLAEYADTINLVRARLSLLTDSTQQAAYYEKRLQDITIATRSSYDGNAKLFVKLAMAGRQYGVSANQAFEVTQNVAKALKISGATAEEAANSTLQLSQAFASGKLQGDELRSILENSPRLAQAFATKLAYLGVNLSNIRKFGKEGKIGITEMVKVLADGSLTKELDAEFKKIPVTMQDALTNTKTKLMIFVGEFDKAFGITPKVVAALGFVADHFQDIAIAAGVAAVAITASYIPAVVAAIAKSRVFLTLSLASYGSGITKAVGGASTAFKGLGGAINAAVTGAGIARVAGLGGTFSGLASVIPAVGRVFMATLGRWPPILAAATVGLVLFKSKFRPIRDEAGTTQDYLVTGFQIAAEKIVSFFEWAFDKINAILESKVGAMLDNVSMLYQGIKYVIGTAIDSPKIVKDSISRTANLATGGLVGRDKKLDFRDYKGARWARTSLGEDFGSLVKDTSWSHRANWRAWQREQALRVAGNGEENIKTGAPPPDTGGKKKKTKKGAVDHSIENMAKELDSLKSELDPTYAAQSKFNDGVKTLSESFRSGKLTVQDYSKYLGFLGENVFPNLKDKIKDLSKENEKLQVSLSGDKTDPRITDARHDTADQVQRIDNIVAVQGDSTGELTRQKQILVDQLGLYEKMVGKNVKLTEQADARKAAEEDISKLIQDGMDKTQEAIVENLRHMLDGTQNFLKTFLGILKDTFAQYLGTSLFATIRSSLKSSLESAFGVNKGHSDSGVIGSGGHPTGAASAIIKGGSPANVTVNNIVAKYATDPSKSVKKETAANDNTSDGQPDIVVTGRRQTKGFFPNFVEGYKETFKDIGKSLSSILEPIGKAFGKLGINTGKLGKALGQVYAGYQIGSGAAQLLGSGKTKESQKGGVVGAAVGGTAFAAFGLPPGVGAAIGSFFGSIIGGLFHKPIASSAIISGTNGASDVKVVGQTKDYIKASTAEGASIQKSLRDLAASLGGEANGKFKVSIGKREDYFRVSAIGNPDVDRKYPDKVGLVYNGTDEAAALAEAVKAAVRQGAITGLSATSDRLLRTLDDIDRAIELVQAIEGVKKSAAQIRDPLKAAYDDLKHNLSDLTAKFTEAGASASEWADLSTVAQYEFSQALKDATAGLISFRDSITSGDLSYLSPSEKLSAASDKFSAYETRINKGDFSFTQDEFTQAGTALQSLAREVYGSTPEFAAFQQRLLDATNKVIANAQATADQYKPVVDAIAIAAEKANSDAGTQIDILKNIAAAVGGGGSGLNENKADFGRIVFQANQGY